MPERQDHHHAHCRMKIQSSKGKNSTEWMDDINLNFHVCLEFPLRWKCIFSMKYSIADVAARVGGCVYDGNERLCHYYYCNNASSAYSLSLFSCCGITDDGGNLMHTKIHCMHLKCTQCTCTWMYIEWHVSMRLRCSVCVQGTKSCCE